MSTDVDASRPGATRPGTSRHVWLAVAVVVALGAAFAILRSGPFGGSGEQGDYSEQLSATLINVLEQLPAADHGHHGDAAGGMTGDAAGGAAAARLVCGVRVFGTDPVDADEVAEVRRAYGYHMCATPEPGLDWLLSYKLTGPLVVDLSARPPTVTVAEGGERYRERVREIIPARYQEQAYVSSLTPEGMKELIRRYDEAADA